MIGGFVRENLQSLTEEDLDALEALMERPDPDLADWLTGRCEIPPEFDTVLLRAIKEAQGR